MSGGKQTAPLVSSSGYTVIEVIIFLAISGLMFAIAAIFINGKQASVEFRNDIRNFNAIVQTAVNNASDGSYPNQGTISCTVAGTTVTLGMGSNPQGTSDQCIFLGNALYFPSNNSYTTESIAGRRLTGAGGTDVTSLTGASGAAPIFITGSAQTQSLGGVTVDKLCVATAPGAPLSTQSFGIAAVPSLNGTVGFSGGTIRNVNLYAYADPTYHSSANDEQPSNLTVNVDRAAIYLNDGLGRTASITITTGDGINTTVTYSPTGGFPC